MMRFCMVKGIDAPVLQSRNLIPAPVDRTSASAWLYKHPWITCQETMLNPSMIHQACESKLRSIVRSSMHRELGGNWVCGRVLWSAAHTLSAGIKCRHCRVASTHSSPLPVA